ncbi:MalY/PatB family protein [Bacillus sp. DTU_2020_1000418_1_SI_GHA_SEK_038]|uniref:MalY/PatB family protein n=1 Tax=Bacillus sp. DTU_2020_1000418_1_SI_GHA_SEK_038 TaxID=3077585 RepID=UPI0028EFC094|nr:MalY/PatB family protein [Bacillus sp. DTU_2020_1000418_1_SI_GHA_SEK_038]WNS74767.1 MalY/PatB family protein [Bacillus sp. DTU_2020_1000418_1_SI_GHA_SEK_038]
MKKFDFDQIINRENTSSVKWGLTKEVFGTNDVLPMWVADMDFEPPSEVKNALLDRVQHGVFGYTYPSSSTADSIKQWLQNRHSWKVESDWIQYNLGVVPSIAAAIEAYTAPGDKVMLQSPVYAPFFEMVKKNNREVVNSPLKLVDNRFEIDFTDFENRLKEGVKLFLLCNPHNPGGRVWTKEELQKIGELCYQYNCLILSDEIHSDLVFKTNKHIPIASLNNKFNEITITCIAPTKTFNLAGLQASAVIISNKELRNDFQKVLQRQGFYSLPTFGAIGMEAAYQHGDSWLNELLEYLHENIATAKSFIEKHLPSIKVMEPEGTYLLWLNCRELDLGDEEIRERLLYKGKLALEPGKKYGPGGEGFVRMNIACPREMLLDGLERLKKAFD